MQIPMHFRMKLEGKPLESYIVCFWEFFGFQGVFPTLSDSFWNYFWECRGGPCVFATEIRVLRRKCSRGIWYLAHLRKSPCVIIRIEDFPSVFVSLMRIWLKQHDRYLFAGVLQGFCRGFAWVLHKLIFRYFTTSNCRFYPKIRQFRPTQIKKI